MSDGSIAKAGEYYDEYWSESGYSPIGGVLHPVVAQLFETRISQGARCLEVGCGDGQTVGSWLVRRGYEYTGVDISDNAVRLARAAGLDARRVADACALPFEDASFDAATCVEVMEHLFLPARATAEILRVLKPGGVLILTVPNVAYWRRRLDLTLFGRWNPVGDELSVEQPWRDPHIRFFNRAALRRMLCTAGYESVEVRGHGGSLTRDIPLARNLVRSAVGSRFYRLAEKVLPSLFSSRLHAVAYKPDVQR